MPHAEYPSASACVCAAYARANQVRYGTDLLLFPLSAEFEAFSSEYEPLSTPSTNITKLYFAWSDIAKRCSDTRMEGGMHFSESVSSGASLCEPIGEQVSIILNNLRNGIAPEYVIDINDTEIRERTCFPNKNHCKLPKKCENSPCMEHEAGNCKNYKNGVGCKKCENGFYLFNYNYPCIECQASCSNCKSCKDFVGCKKCNSNYGLAVDNSTNLQFCETK